MENSIDYSIDYTILPESLQGGVRRYIEQGILPGSFLMAVIENDLLNAVSCADKDNLLDLKGVVSFFHWEAPGACWKSEEKMLAWKEKGGLWGQ